ncbi:I78 family peptidase inhibitor [Novosphingobium mangrovi (ex Huang et al. 2023)]|uniref:I78 family peptidase inhibitor n=1 Tax=Novosphingobium mangrovi (ex Huang et al. 2023) TaxID=2976432 RepID=A0ABT2I6V5_9SPHN|nr:I78 family peptidase inhibitor [Novosphingobium mangrovi (ex Huang et al. 2023)]MCT2400536.1 I78 family peptidase inhibitor [Novosphingobium mangrovi (ex Huang et al. 2023)]
MTAPRLAAIVTLLSLAACSTETPPPAPTPAPPTPQGCGAEQLGAYVGQPASDAVLARIREWRGDKPIRVLKPGSAMTMDYRPERLNIFLDDKGMIEKFQCN